MKGRGKEKSLTKWLVAAAVMAAAAFLIWGALKHRHEVMARFTKPQAPTPPATAAPATAETKAQIFFADAEYTALVAETRDIGATTSAEERTRRVINALLAGPDAPDHSPTLPREALLKSVFLRDDVAILNFDEHLRSKRFGSAGELYALNSIYRTVTANVPGVSGVIILVEGRLYQTLAGDGGHVAAGYPIYGELGEFVAGPPKPKRP